MNFLPQSGYPKRVLVCKIHLSPIFYCPVCMNSCPLQTPSLVPRFERLGFSEAIRVRIPLACSRRCIVDFDDEKLSEKLRIDVWGSFNDSLTIIRSCLWLHFLERPDRCRSFVERFGRCFTGRLDVVCRRLPISADLRNRLSVRVQKYNTIMSYCK